jgi:hypothetical protein
LYRAIWVFILILWGAAGCGSVGESTNDSKGFGLAIDQFHSAVRWEAYDRALRFVSPPLVDDFYLLTDILQDKVRIMEYEVRNLSFDEKGEAATATVFFKLYRQNSPQLQTRTIREKWAYADKEKTWQIVQHDMTELMR